MDTNRIWFTADTHFCHRNIIKYTHRPFLCHKDQKVFDSLGRQWHKGTWKGKDASRYQLSQDSVEIMNTHLIDQINAHVGPDDTLWHLGDFALLSSKTRYYDEARRCRDRIVCQNINIIWGNHDSYTKPEPTADDYVLRDLFNKAFHLQHIAGPNKIKITLCHYAMAVFNKSHRYGIQLYGHSHSGAEPWMDKHLPDRRSLDVGVDNIAKLYGAYRPISLTEILKRVEGTLGHVMDHHINRDAPSEEDL